MQERIRGSAKAWLLIAAAGLGGERAQAQSLLDRSPNTAGAWVPRPGVVQFNFVHRFSRTPAPERKVASFPTFLVSAGLPARTSAGFLYTTNSALVAGYPNEWEFFARALPLSQADEQPVDASVQVGYNLATEGLAGELVVARREGRLRVLGIARLLSPLDDDDITRAALGGGAAFRITNAVGVAGDLVTLTGRGPLDERAAWSAGLHVAIPNSPHTLSLHVSNVPATTLQSASRGTSETRFGFEFTIPITLARYFGGRAPAAALGEPGDSVRRIEIRDLAFGRTLEVVAGTTVEWINRDPLQHTITAEDGSFNSGLVDPGARWRRTFTEPGTYRYHCTPHPFMRGTIIVKASP